MQQQQQHIYFKSNGLAKYRILSNFAATPVTLNVHTMPTYKSLISHRIDPLLLPSPLKFPSLEHACQALKADDQATFEMFLSGGKFAALTADIVAWLTTKKDWKKKACEDYAKDKVKYYSSAGQVMVGVVAKYAANGDRAKRLGYRLRPNREFLPEATEAALWQELLLAKYRQNAGARRVLLGTGTLRIVEFDGRLGAKSHWGGLVKDGTIMGKNRMGVYLEGVRAELSTDTEVSGAATLASVIVPGTKRAREPLAEGEEEEEDEKEEEEPAPKKAKPATRVLHPTGPMNIIDDGQALVPYEPAFWTQEEADAIFQELLTTIPWEKETFHRWNKDIDTPRLVYAYGDPGVNYRYISLNRIGAPWTPTMFGLKARVEAYCGVVFNYCFVNLYRDGQDGIQWHSDDEKALIPDHQIAAVSLNAKDGERDLVFKNKETGEKRSILLGHGSLYVMKGATQKRYKHAVPRRSKVKTARINLTFRQIKHDV